MRFGEILRLVWVNITENFFKVVLTSIGILVGSATIVLVIAVGRGGQMDVAEQFKNLNAASIEITAPSNSRSFSGGSGGGPIFFITDSGSAGSSGGRSQQTNNVVVMPGGMSGSNMPGGMPGGMPSFFGSLRTVTATLEYSDVEDILIFVPNVKQATLSANTPADVLGGTLEEETSATVVGVYPEYQETSNLSLYLGEFITRADVDESAKVCVLGYRLALSMYDSLDDIYDSVITIDGTKFTVIGMLDEMGTVSSGISSDNAVYIPYATGKKYIFGNSLSPSISVVAYEVEQVADVSSDAEMLLGENYPGVSFSISDAGSKMDAAAKSSETLSSLLLAVAVIVFIVGGIGIMNVLFVSVKERTSEIGVLKALGMSREHILLDFLLEAVFISFVGGVLGGVVSLAVVPIVETLGVRMEPNISAYIMAFVFAVVTGTLFGFYPALKASKLVPVEALSSD